MSKRKAPKGCFWRGATLWGRVEVKGRDIKWSLRTDDPEIAKRRRKAERDRQLAAAYFGDHRRMFQDVMAEWEAMVRRNVSPRTAARYGTSLGQLAPYLAGCYLDEIDGELVADIIKRRAETGVTNATIKRDLGAVSSVLNFAIDQGYREDNPILPRLKRLKERRDPIILPDHAHIQMVIDRAPGLFAKLIQGALLTGARLDELAKARRTQIDHARKQLTVVGKRNKLRVIDLDGWGYDEVFKTLPASIGTAHLFWHHQGEPYRTVSGRFRTIVASVRKSAQKQEQDFRPFRFHDLRHRHAVDWLKAGGSIYDLKHRLGHTSIKTTEIYLAYLTPEEARNAMQAGTKAGT
jgi:integrase/recombinase XerD